MEQTNPYASPSSAGTLATPAENIANLDVSEVWKERFTIIEKAGGPRMPRFKELSTPEKRKVYSWLGFFFGVFYYCYLGMWKKGLLYTVAWLVLAVALISTGIEFLARPLGFVLAIFYGFMTSRDYYNNKVLGDKTFW